MEEKKLGLVSVVSVSVGLVIATSCLVSLGEGAGTIGLAFIIAMIIACLFNLTTIASLSELNALMPNITGGLAQYTLAGIGPFPTMVSMVGGYLLSNTLSSGVEASIFAYSMEEIFGLPIPSITYVAIVSAILLVVNLQGIDMFAKIQNLVAILLVGSMVIMGIIGMVGMGTGEIVEQEMWMATDFQSIVSMTAVAFWLFIGAEYVIPISKDVKNAKRNVPLGMMLGLILICIVQIILVIGFYHYTPWSELSASGAPHLLYGYYLLGDVGRYWMAFVASLALISTQNSTINGLSSICQGMAKMNMMPQAFGKTNKNGVPYVGIWFVSISIFLFAVMSSVSTDAIGFFILVGSVFWMVSYVFTHVNVLVLRKRLPKAPRSFKVPGGPVIPVAGIAGILYMILNISTDPAERLAIWGLTGGTFVILSIFSIWWIKTRMKLPVFKSVPLEKVMAMENDMYYATRKHRGIYK